MNPYVCQIEKMVDAIRDRFNSQIAVLILVFQPIMMSVVSPIAGKISDRIEPG